MIGKQKCDNVRVVQKTEDRKNPGQEEAHGFLFCRKTERRGQSFPFHIRVTEKAVPLFLRDGSGFWRIEGSTAVEMTLKGVEKDENDS